MGKWIVGAAWPYVNTIPHLGTMIQMLSADVFVRFLKLMGEDVVFVSGSDEHGTPIEVEARIRGVDPKAFTDAVHNYVINLFNKWLIDFSLYTRTESEHHKEFVREFMDNLYKRGYIFSKIMVMPYCPRDKIFLPDRFIEGICPICGYESARGDQCDNCGVLLDPTDLINPRCVFCNSRPIYKKTKHWFFDLSKLETEIKEWLLNHKTIGENVKTYCFEWLKRGLKPRSITRDNKWGIPAPFKEAEGKTIYVWFEALLGYLSASKKYLESIGKKFEDYWFNPETKTAYFIGKDNIPFHAIILPAMLMASGEPYVLPHRVASTEYLMFEGQKFSKSKRIGIWIDEALKIVNDPDYWRFALIRMRPETKDTSFTWREFFRIVNNELNDDIGNFIHRVLSLIYRGFNGKVPKPRNILDIDREFLEQVKKCYEEYVVRMYNAELKAGSEKILEIARLGNQFLNRRAPWKLIKQKPSEAASVLHILVNVVRGLVLCLTPLTPNAASKAWVMLKLGNKPKSNELKTAFDLILKPGHEILKPSPLFKKLPSDFLKLVNELISRARNEVLKERPEFVK
ncbi:MAG: methionine--tRNA ligase [Thermoprotei archaeon]|nr:MAG: methionine--tRNA ligase [Thermoprotei archaeon]